MPCDLTAQSVPKERRIRHREQTLLSYDPFTADEIWKRIAIPPSPALSVADALKSFTIAPGFRIECVAAEPLVVDPVMFEFDPDGRIWAVEFRGWMIDIKGTGEADPIGQVVVLEDTDGDSVMDKSTVFLDKLVMPRTVQFVEGGVLVAEPPNLWYCQDTDGDLRCDKKKLVGSYGVPGNPEHTENALMPALDNWMYSANADVRHRFIDGKLIEEKTMRRGQWGMSQDDFGRLHYNYENRPLHADLFPSEYLERNKNVSQYRAHPGMNYDVARNAREVFPVRVTPGITLGGNELRDDGTLRTFTIACGPSIYRGDQFPDKYYGGSVIPEAAGNLVRLNNTHTDGVDLEAENAFGEREWVASTDERFRPVCSRTGPDGAVYICDLYRGIIEHVIYMMPYLQHQILSRGLDKPAGLGRIYRIVHEDRPLGSQPRMSDESSPALVNHLSHANGWWRDTAQRLLVERKAVDAVGELRELAREGEKPLGRIHAMWVLEGIGQLDWETVAANFEHKDAMVRAMAIRLSERFLESQRAEVVTRLKEVLSDERPMVRLQLLLTLGEVKGKAAEQMMAAILADRADPVFREAAVSGMAGRELEFLTDLLGEFSWSEKQERQSGVLEILAQGVVHEGEPGRVARLLEIAKPDAAELEWVANAVLRGVLGSQISRSKWPAPIVLSERPAILDSLLASADANWRQQADRLVRIITWPGDTTEREERPVVRELTAVEEKRRVLGKAVYDATCFSCHLEHGRGQPGKVPPLADSDWVNGSPEHLVRIALQGLHGPIEVNGEKWELTMPGLGQSPLLNDERLAGVLTYIRREWGNYGESVEPELVASVRKDTAGRTALWTVEELLYPERAAPQASAPVGDPLDKFRAGLAEGDRERGRVLFHTNIKVRCNACHKVGRFGGGFVGPDLTGVGKRLSQADLLESLIVPSAKIAKGYNTLLIVTDEGKIHSGIVVSENEKETVLALPAGGTVAIASDQIEERVDSSISSMPQMGTAFSAEEIADLVAYLASLKSAEEASE